MTLLPTCWWEIQNLSGILHVFGNEGLLQDFCTQQHIVEKRGLGYILLINQLKASSVWSLLHSPSVHSSAWTLTSASCFCGRFVFDLQTKRVNKSAISSEAFAVFHQEIYWIQSWNPPCLWNPKLHTCNCPPPSPMPLEFQSKKLPSPSEFQDAVCGMVWIFSGITHCFRLFWNRILFLKLYFFTMCNFIAVNFSPGGNFFLAWIYFIMIFLTAIIFLSWRD